MTLRSSKSRLQLLMGTEKDDLHGASRKTLLYLGQPDTKHGLNGDQVTANEVPVTSVQARPQAVSQHRKSRLQIVLGSEKQELQRASSKSKLYLNKLDGDASSTSGSFRQGRVTTAVETRAATTTGAGTSTTATAKGLEVRQPTAPTHRVIGRGRRAPSTSACGGSAWTRLLITLGLMSGGAQGAFTVGVDIAFTVPPLGVAGPIEGQVTGLPGGPELYKLIVLFNGQCNIWWDKGHNRYRTAADPATAQNGGVPLDGEGNFRLEGWEYQTSEYDVLAGHIAVFAVPQTMDLSWPAYILENYWIHDYVWNDAVSWLFVDRTGCTDQAVPCNQDTGAWYYAAQRPGYGVGMEPMPDPAVQCDPPYGPPPPGEPVIPGGPVPNVPPPPTPTPSPTATGTPSGTPTPTATTSASPGSAASNAPTQTPRGVITDPVGGGTVVGAGSGGATTAPALTLALVVMLITAMLTAA